MSNAGYLYRGDRSGLASTGFFSFQARTLGAFQALTDLLNADLSVLEGRMEEHARSKFLSWFVSVTSDIRVACYFATDGCQRAGSIYVLDKRSFARENLFNQTQILLCDGITETKELEWVWFSYIDPAYILDEYAVEPGDCRNLPND